MAVYSPLKSSEKIEGVICFITSLRQVNNQILKISLMIIFIGFFVLIVSGMISIKIADGIVRPIKELTSAAEKMAGGDFKAKSIKRYNDEIGKLAETFNYMSEEILKRDKIKDEFISSVSHELRTPLTSIKGWAVTLKTGDLEDKEILTTGLDIIENESDRLTSMVEELLNLSSFISRGNKLSKTRFQLLGFIKNIKKQLEPRVNEAGINLLINTLNDEVYLFADLDKIKQVFINIIDNAIRFTKSGGNIIVDYYVEDDYIYIKIKDNGAGIPEDELPYVKDKFFKGKSSKSKNGIGLAICDEIIRQHGGILDIKSKVNQGTEVVIRLPYTEANYEE
ncbi:sensor histidine kinase [Fervidicella metallireducens]|uniref:sensor histidine kinase n=1 Tax=Fervidicella metallireducens TaxID=655338 RepID=UPI000A74804C|nr:HAMP domain-containing sensor histidine kinase [Fervidicella metallireducens]